MIVTVLFYSFIGLTVIQIIYYLIFSSLLLKGKERKFIEHFPPVSLVIYTKNNLEILKQNLNAFLSQKDVEFELVIVNNASSDGTKDYLETVEEKHDFIKIVNVENNEAFWGSKKYALTLGIKATRHELLVFSDARVQPISEFWLSNMVAEFSEDKKIVIGHSANASKNTLINLFSKYYQTNRALFSLSFANLGAANQASEFNYAFHKEDFFRVKGFVNHMSINFAEADLFLKDASKRKNTTICLSKNGVVTTSENESFSSFLKRLRQDRFLKNHYKENYSFHLSFFNFSKFLFYLAGISLLFIHPWQQVSYIFGGYYFTLSLIVGLCSRRLNTGIFFLFLPILDLLNLLIQIVIFIADSVARPKF